jgi:hypothetical protein
MASDDDEQRRVAQKGADFGPKPNGAPKKRAALAAALRANISRRKARERALKESAQAKHRKSDSEG